MGKILKGIDAIGKYIDPECPVSRDKVHYFIQRGMPARKDGGIWYAHADNVDNFFKYFTNIDNRNAPPETFQE